MVLNHLPFQLFGEATSHPMGIHDILVILVYLHVVPFDLIQSPSHVPQILLENHRITVRFGPSILEPVLEIVKGLLQESGRSDDRDAVIALFPCLPDGFGHCVDLSSDRNLRTGQFERPAQIFIIRWLNGECCSCHAILLLAERSDVDWRACHDLLITMSKSGVNKEEKKSVETKAENVVTTKWADPLWILLPSVEHLLSSLTSLHQEFETPFTWYHVLAGGPYFHPFPRLPSMNLRCFALSIHWIITLLWPFCIRRVINKLNPEPALFYSMCHLDHYCITYSSDSFSLELRNCNTISTTTSCSCKPAFTSQDHFFDTTCLGVVSQGHLHHSIWLIIPFLSWLSGLKTPPNWVVVIVSFPYRDTNH